MHKMMRAVGLKAFGGPEQLFLAKAPRPKLDRPGQVLVKIMAAGVNRADTLQRQGLYPPPKGESTVIGLEVAGRVVALAPPPPPPPDAERSANSPLPFQPAPLKVGDRVMGLIQGGGYAEYAAVPEALLLRIPGHLSYAQAACIPEAFLTAFQHLSFTAGFHKKDQVLVHGGASGVGLALTQLAASKVGGSNNVISTVRTEGKVDTCLAAGAHHVIVPKNGLFAEKVKEATMNKGADIILDCVGAAYWQENLFAAALDARWVLYGTMGGYKVPNMSMRALLKKRINLIATTLRSRSQIYREELLRAFAADVLPGFEDDSLRANLDTVFKLEEVARAHERMESNQNAGKIILEVHDDDSLDVD
eukprot:Selendium_serpulae@DN4668_c0_g1_i1.p1